MTTALQMIKTALRRTGALAAGETPTSDESEDARQTLNTMLDAWATNRLMVYQILQEALSVVANTASYTIGSGGVFNTTRPTKLDDSSFIRISGIDYPLTLVAADAYAATPVKGTLSTIPYVIACDYAYPLATIYLYPTPSAAATLYLRSWKVLQSFAALTTDLALPPGYQRAIEWNLAKELCPEYGVPVTNDIMREAVGSKLGITSINAPPLTMVNESAAMRFRSAPLNVKQG